MSDAAKPREKDIMAAVSALLYYGASLEPCGSDDWLIDGVSHAPEVVLNFRKVAVETRIDDLRALPIAPKLDVMGFEMCAAPARVDHAALLAGSAAALALQQQATAALLRTLTAADDVVFFDATLRSEDTDAPRAHASQPAHLRVHVDQNPASARARAVNHGGARRRFRRFQIVNVWQPLIAPVRNFPLALCDNRSIDMRDDLVVTRLHFPAWLKDRENYSLKANPQHRWYYWSAMTPDELVVFKCYDSACRELALASGDGDPQGRGGLIDVAGLCPHTAFVDPHGPMRGRLRVSLELRALLFYD